jgi:hypothetical protein
MIGEAMIPSTVTAAPTMPVAIANTVEVRIWPRLRVIDGGKNEAPVD